MLNNEQVLDIFRQSNALLEGHFRLTSGRHSNRYMQCAQVLQYPQHTTTLCTEIVEYFAAAGVEVVIGPAMGGIVVAFEVGRQLGVKAIFTERENGQMTLRRNFSIQPGQKVLVVEDVVTTGGSVFEVMEVVKAQGGDIVGVGVLVDRSNGTVDFGVPTKAVMAMEVVSWEAEDCPLCAQGTPVVKPGSRQV